MMKTKIDYQEQKRNINGKRIRVVYLTMNWTRRKRWKKIEFYK
jgi:hypothetical protein